MSAGGPAGVPARRSGGVTVIAPRKLAAVCCVALLHVALLWLMDKARTGRPVTVATTDHRVTVRMVPAAMPSPAPTPPTAEVAPNTAATRPGARRAARGAPRLTPPAVVTPQAVDGATPAAPAAPAAPDIAAVPAAAPASAARSIGSLLDSEATRNAIRASARAASLRDRVAATGGEPAPVSTPDRLGQSVARGARGDCAKGEYLGGGMGLLSLPFLAAAALSEKCAR
jgi:hypothetical protein